MSIYVPRQKDLWGMLNRINVRQIVEDHFRTLHATGSKAVERSDIILFYVLPLTITALTMLLFGLRVSDGLAQALFTGVSIFAGLLFNLQILIYDNIRNIPERPSLQPGQKEFRVFLFRELFSNVSYAILVSLVLIALIGFHSLSFSAEGWLPTTKEALEPIFTASRWIIALLIISVTIHFVLTMFMVLKRVHLLLSKELDNVGIGE